MAGLAHWAPGSMGGGGTKIYTRCRFTQAHEAREGEVEVEGPRGRSETPRIAQRRRFTLLYAILLSWFAA